MTHTYTHILLALVPSPRPCRPAAAAFLVVALLDRPGLLPLGQHGLQPRDDRRAVYVAVALSHCRPAASKARILSITASPPVGKLGLTVVLKGFQYTKMKRTIVFTFDTSILT